MRYEQFLFTRNQERDFTAFVRPAALTNKDIGTIGNIFNYVHEIARLARDFPSVYCFAIGEYYLLVRHYNSGRRHAGRAIGVIEGIAVHQSEGSNFARALPDFLADLEQLNVVDTLPDLESHATSLSPVIIWQGSTAPRIPNDDFVGEFLGRIDDDRLFLPFSQRGWMMLRAVLNYHPYAAPPLFAFGTNSSALGEFAARGIDMDVVSYFNTGVPAYRSRETGQKSGSVLDFPWEEPEVSVAPSMAIRPVTGDDTIPEYLGERPKPPPAAPPPVTPRARLDQPSDILSDETPLLTIREMRDRIRAETALEPPPPPTGFDPLRWVMRLFESLISKHK